MKRHLLSILMLMTGFVTMNAQSDSDRNFMNQVTTDFVDQWDSDAYHNVLELINEMCQYDTQEISQWVADALGAMKVPNSSGISTGYMLMIGAAKFTGHFKVVAGRWVYEGDANDLQFSFSDQAGNPCVARFAASTKTKTISVPYEPDDDGFDDDDDDYYGDYDDDDDTYGFFFKGFKDLMSDVNEISFEVPESVEISFTQGGKQIMLTTIEFDLSAFKNDWESLTDGFIVSTHSTFAKSDGNGTFELSSDRVGYQDGTGFNLAFNAKSNGNQLLSLRFTAPGTLNLDDGNLISLTSGMISDIGIESLNLDIDILGRFQAHGAIPDLNGFFEVLYDIEDIEDEDESIPIQNEINKKFDGKFYYNGSTTPQGSIGLELVYDDWYEEWTLEPTITFYSNNSTCPLPAFFNEDNFPELINHMQSIMNGMTDAVVSLSESIKRISDEVTGIKEMKNGQWTTDNGQWYDLNGQIVNSKSSNRGIYIVKSPNGWRKVIKK